MPHQIQDIDDYHEGDAMHIHVTVTKQDGTAVDLTGATAEWLLKSDARDADSEALLTKDTAGGGVAITDAEAGQLTIYIDTGDTTGFGSGTYHHRLRVTDADSDRVTVLHGNFAIEV